MARPSYRNELKLPLLDMERHCQQGLIPREAAKRVYREWRGRGLPFTGGELSSVLLLERHRLDCLNDLRLMIAHGLGDWPEHRPEESAVIVCPIGTISSPMKVTTRTRSLIYWLNRLAGRPV
jgi:hypothetical protein